MGNSKELFGDQQNTKIFSFVISDQQKNENLKKDDPRETIIQNQATQKASKPNGGDSPSRL
jgi:hypothetical protein